jgi:hypothetical protein
MPLIFDVEIEIAHFCDYAGQLLVWQAKEDTIVDINNNDYVTAIEDTIVNLRLFEVDLEEFVDEITVPNSPSLFLNVHIRKEFEDMVLLVAFFEKNVIWEFHIHIHFDGSLWIGHHEVDLLKWPWE